MALVWPPVYECLISHDRFIDFWQAIQLGPLDWGPGYSSAYVIWGLCCWSVTRSSACLNSQHHGSKLYSCPHLLSFNISTKASDLLHPSIYPSAHPAKIYCACFQSRLKGKKKKKYDYYFQGVHPLLDKFINQAKASKSRMLPCTLIEELVSSEGDDGSY